MLIKRRDIVSFEHKSKTLIGKSSTIRYRKTHFPGKVWLVCCKLHSLLIGNLSKRLSRLRQPSDTFIIANIEICQLGSCSTLEFRTETLELWSSLSHTEIGNADLAFIYAKSMNYISNEPLTLAIDWPRAWSPGPVPNKRPIKKWNDLNRWILRHFRKVFEQDELFYVKRNGKFAD